MAAVLVGLSSYASRIVIDAYWRTRRSRHIVIEHIWEGVYKSFKEVPTCGRGFYGETWKNNSRRKIETLLEEAEARKFIPSVVAHSGSLLPMLTAIVSETTERVRVLDFGGGLGFTYVPVVSGLATQDALDYFIVDNEAVCEVGNQVFGQDSRINFRASLSNDLDTFDIVHLGSSLQYIEDWRALIKQLGRYRPRYFLFSDLLAGDIPTYVTAQNYYESKIACWFFNVQEIIDAMGAIDFKLLFKSTYVNTYFGEKHQCPQDNFPPELRLGYPCCLLFSAKATE